VAKLDKLCKRVTGYVPRVQSVQAAQAPRAAAPAAPSGGGGGWLGGLFGGGGQAPAKAPAPAPRPQRTAAPDMRGLYVWGSCGTGKTFLMDLFYESVPVARKKRIHFHEWMIDVHERLHRLQKRNAMVQEKANTVWTAEAAKAQRQQLKDSSGEQKGSADDLVAQVANEMMGEAWLLCFDEFQVTHISDAIILKQIFSVLFERGAVVVATSNRPPEDLYLNGLNRSLFLPFIPMLKDFCEVHPIGAEVDYRMISTQDGEDDRVTEDDRKNSTFDEIFAWDRAVSRLIEMQSTKYISDFSRSLGAGQFIGQYKITSLTDEDMKELWRRYDADDSGELHMDEVRVLLEDLLEEQRGHRNLSDEVFETCRSVIDLNHDGVVSFEEFKTYLGDYTTVRSTMSM